MQDKIDFILRNNIKTTIPMNFDEFLILADKYNLKEVKGLAILSDKEATIFFEQFSNVTFIVKSKKYITKNDLLDFKLVKKGALEPITFAKYIYGEIAINKFALIIIFLLLTPFLLIQDDKEFVKEINTVLISANSILVGIFLVFITFFYLGRVHDIKYFTEGRFYNHFKNDKYIILFAFITILFSLSAISISYYTFDPNTFAGENVGRFIYILFAFILEAPYQKPISGLVTVISFMGFWINFKAMTGYYFDRIKNGIYKEALEKIHDDYFSKKK